MRLADRLHLNRAQADALVLIKRHPLNRFESELVETILRKAEVPPGKPSRNQPSATTSGGQHARRCRQGRAEGERSSALTAIRRGACDTRAVTPTESAGALATGRPQRLQP